MQSQSAVRTNDIRHWVYLAAYGLERIGQGCRFLLRSLVHRLHWDKALQQLLPELRLVFMPLLNPGGMLLGSRANPNGVDLMRNAPIDADSRALFARRPSL